MASTKSKEYQLAIKIAGGVSSSFNSTMTEAGNKLNNLGTIAKKAAAVAAAAWGALQLGQFIADAIDTYGEFEQSMANTAAIAGATSDQYMALQEAALEMGKATSKSASECADALGYMALAEWSVDDSIKSLEPVLRLSEATQMDLATCSDLVTDSMSALGLQVDDLARYLDIATAANNSANTSSEAFMEAMIGCGGACKTVGVTLIDTSTAIGILANNGTKGSEAGTALNSMLARLSSNDAAIKAMKSLGISAFDAYGEFVGLQNFLQQTQGALSNLSTEQQAYYLKQIAGANYFTEMSYLLDSVKESTDGSATAWDKLSASLENSEGALSTMAATVTNTWQGAKARLDSAIDDLKINIVSTFAPYAIDAINGVAAALPNVTEAVTGAAKSFMDYAIPKVVAFKDRAVETFNAIRPTLEAIGEKGKAAFTFLAGAAKTALQGIGDAVKKHSGLFQKLGQIATNVGAIISDIGQRLKPVISYASGTALPAIADAVLTVVEKLADLAVKITENKGLVIALVSAFAAFKGITAISALGNKITTASTALAEFERITKGTSLVASALNGKLPAASTAFGVLTGKIKLSELAMEGAKTKWTAFTGGFKSIGNLAKTAFTGLKSGITSIGTTLAGVGSKIMAFVAANPVVLIIAAIAAVIAIIVVLYNKCEWFREKVDAIIEAIKGFLQAFWEKAKAVFEQIWAVIKQAWDALQPYIEAAKQTILAAVGAVMDFFTGSVLPGLQAVWNSICGVFKAAWELIKVIWEKAQPFFQAIGEAIKAIFAIVGPILSGFFKVAWAVIQAIWSVAGKYFSLIWTEIKAVFSVVAAVLGGFFSTAWEVIKAVWNTVVGYFQAIFDTIAGIFSFVKSILSGDFAGAWEAIKGIVSTWAGFFQTVWDGIKNIFGAVVDWFSGVFSAAWEAIKSVFAGVGEFFKGVWDTIVSLFTSIGTAVSDAISGAVRGAINAVLSGAIGIINGFINAINFAIGVINKIPGVSISTLETLSVPQLAKGGLVSDPTLLEAGEAGTEAIIPLSELWTQMQSMMAEAMGGVKDGISALAEKLDAAEAGARVKSIPSVLDGLTSANQEAGGTEDNSTTYQITYAPQYTFTGDKVDKEEVMEAGKLTYEEFERYMNQYTRNNKRKAFA